MYNYLIFDYFLNYHNKHKFFLSKSEQLFRDLLLNM